MALPVCFAQSKIAQYLRHPVAGMIADQKACCIGIRIDDLDGCGLVCAEQRKGRYLRPY
jgi:hypothetical protein